MIDSLHVNVLQEKTYASILTAQHVAMEAMEAEAVEIDWKTLKHVPYEFPTITLQNGDVINLAEKNLIAWTFSVDAKPKDKNA